MTTIKQLAEELGVSKQAIYNRITKEPLKSTLAGMEGALQTNAQGTIFLSEAGEQVIRSAYEEKYKRPSEAPKPIQPVEAVVTRVEFDDSKLDEILEQVCKMQTSLELLVRQAAEKDATIEQLTVRLEESNAKNAEVSRTAKKLTRLGATREAELQALKEKYAKLLRKKRDEVSETVVVEACVEVPEPEPDMPAPVEETVVVEPEAPAEHVSEEPKASAESVAEELESPKPVEPPKSSILGLDLYEPLISLSSDLSKPTSRLAGLFINE